MYRFEQDRDLIRRRWFNRFRRMKHRLADRPEFIGHYPELIEPARFRKSRLYNSRYCASKPPRSVKRIWWKSTRQQTRRAILACRDFDTLALTYNHRHAGLYAWA